MTTRTSPRTGSTSAIAPPMGGDLDIGLSATHLQTPGGRAGLLFTFQDVTNIKKLQNDAAIQQRLAAVGEMAAGIAHEIRNPLASMSGSIQILRHELPLSAEQEQLMDIVLRESERLNTTIRSFLAYARPQQFRITRFDIRRALNDTALLLRNSSEIGEEHSIEADVPGTRAVVRGRRGPGQADRLEPGDQRAARDARGRDGFVWRSPSSRRTRALSSPCRMRASGFRPRNWTDCFSRFTAASPKAAASAWRSSTASSATTTERFA